MSNERKELLEALSDLEGVCYEYESLLPIAVYLKKHLAKPAPITPLQRHEEYKRGYWKAVEDLEREPLTGKEISHGFRSDGDATNAESYWAGVAFAEKEHGIGVDDV